MHRILPLNVQYLQTLGTYEIETTTYLKKNKKSRTAIFVTESFEQKIIYIA